MNQLAYQRSVIREEYLDKNEMKDTKLSSPSHMSSLSIKKKRFLIKQEEKK